MKQSGMAVIWALLALSLAAQDGSIHYQNRVQSVFMALQSAVAAPAMSRSVIEVHGQRCRLKLGPLAMLVNFKNSEAVIMNPARREYSRIALNKFSAALQEKFGALQGHAAKTKPAPAQRWLKNLIIHTRMSPAIHSSRTILGIPLIQRTIRVSLKLPSPPRPAGAAAPPMPGGGMSFRIALRVWYATPAAVDAHPALQCLQQMSRFTAQVINPAAWLAEIPGLPQGFAQLSRMYAQIEREQTVMLRTQMKFYSPMMAMMLPLMLQRAHKPLPPGFNPAAPLITVSTTAVALSDQPVSPLEFQIPAGYHRMPFNLQALPGFPSSTSASRKRLPVGTS
jgi:hypothetical protein